MMHCNPFSVVYTRNGLKHENRPMQYTELEKKIDIFNILAQNIDGGFTLEPPCQPYLQSMFWSKNKKSKPHFTT